MKKIFNLLLIALLVLSFSGISAFAYTPYISDDIIKIQSIQFKDMMGEPVVSINPYDMIFVEANAKLGTTGESGQAATLVVAIYSGDTLVDSYSDPGVLSENKGLLSTMAFIPDEPNLSLKAYVWDSLDNARPLASAFIYGDNNAEVTDIVIDGVSVENFDPAVREYDYKVSAAHINFPEVSVVTASTGATAAISVEGKLYQDGASANIVVTSADGTATESYKINYTWDEPQIKNIKFTLPGKSPEPLSTVKVAEPVWDGDSTPLFDPMELLIAGNTDAVQTVKDYPEWFQDNLPSQRTTMYDTRSTWYYMDISPEILGGTSIITPYDATGVQTPTEDLVSFEINRSAYVYVHDNNGASLSHFVNDLGFEYMDARYAYRVESYADYFSYRHLYFYRKEYKVEPGETVTVKLPQSGNSKMYGIIVKFIDDYSLDNSKLTKNSNEVTYPITRQTFIPTYKNINTTENWANIKFYPRYTEPSSEQVPVLWVEDAFLGGNLLRYPTIFNSAGTYTYAEFDVVSSCKIKFIWNDSSTKSTVQNWAFTNGWTSSSTTSKQLIKDGGAAYDCLMGGACYEKEFYVTPGEPIHVKIPIVASARQFYIYSTPIDLQ